MSTRCQIGIYRSKDAKIEDFEVLLYRHSDGYDKAVIPDIMPFLEWWSKGRGIDDTEYAGARLLQYLCNNSDKHSAEFAKEMGHDSDVGLTGIYGHGICKGFHGDIEFFYKIYPNAVEVYDTPFDILIRGCGEFPIIKIVEYVIAKMAGTMVVYKRR